ncbi:GAK system CofD-like protein [Zhongshania borealis]|uniref:GAK system CofD-like protein n=1 Tax=Zhongshania borealis TaxID=889488 RepID=A0ABP7WQ40_9GAMM
MPSVKVTRSVDIPDLLRISRYYKMPELGPKLLFFSGGSALNGLCRELKNYTHNSIHLVTPFDSGGSSAKLRQAFAMPAIGDLRSRLMALADESVLGHPEIYTLFNYRLPKTGSNKDLQLELRQLAQGLAPQIVDINNPMRQLICNYLQFFCDAMPKEFDLRGASIGNLILAGGYLNNQQYLDPIIFLFSKLVNVQGTVRAVVNDNLHLGAVLRDGTEIIGQHHLSGKEQPPLSSAIETLFLSSSRDQQQVASPSLRKKNRKLIATAELICFPPGSFYSSLIANLIPKGVGRAVAANDCPKVYIPNLGYDPEQIGMTLEGMVSGLLQQLRRDFEGEEIEGRLLDFIIIDSRNGDYLGELSKAFLQANDIVLIDLKLISKHSAPYYDNQLLVSALLSLT